MCKCCEDSKNEYLGLNGLPVGVGVCRIKGDCIIASLNGELLYKYYRDEELKKTKQLDKVEEALGFKLYRWQKSFIDVGKFRNYGSTTAEILKELLEIDAGPIDFSNHSIGARECLYRDELRHIKIKLDEAGVKTRDIARNKDELSKYHTVYKIMVTGDSHDYRMVFNCTFNTLEEAKNRISAIAGDHRRYCSDGPKELNDNTVRIGGLIYEISMSREEVK